MDRRNFFSRAFGVAVTAAVPTTVLKQILDTITISDMPELPDMPVINGDDNFPAEHIDPPIDQSLGNIYLATLRVTGELTIEA